MQPEIGIFGLEIKTFGVMFALAFVAAGALVARRFEETGRTRDEAYELVLAGLVGGLIGARLYYLFQNWDEASEDLIGSLFSGSGLVWYGGAIGGAAAVIAWAKWRGLLSITLLDVVAPALAFGYAVGRIGCQVSGDGDYGVESSLPWAMAYPDGAVPTTEEVHPTPIYETLAMGTAAIVLWRLRMRARAGALFALYLVLAGLERLLVEFLRRNDEVLLGLTAAQLESLAMMAAGIVWLALLRRDGPAFSASPSAPRAARA